MDSRAKELVAIGDRLFSKKSSLDSLRQEIAGLYYFERADFTSASALGTDYAAGTMTSYPHLARRELGQLFPALLRAGKWFTPHVKDTELDERDDVRRVLDWAGDVQMRAMRDSDSGFLMAVDESDDDLITFGDAVVSVEVNMARAALLYRDWHPRDCVWTDDETRKTDALWRKWRASIRILKNKFKNIHPDLERRAKEEPDHEVNCRHIVMRGEDYGYDEGAARNLPFMSLYIDVDSDFVLEQKPIAWFPYVVPRWGTISGSQYGYSPAIVMPDARSANIVRAVMLDAGEHAVNPAMIAVQDAIRGDIANYPGGITFADIEYDERLGEVLRPITRDNRALPFGRDLEELFQETIANSFFLNKLILPPSQGEKTAYEIQKRIQEHIRASSALFDPIDAGYSAPLLETTFEALLSVNTFGERDPQTGAIKDWPRELAGKTIEYEFVNPIRETEKEMKAQRFTQGLQIAEAVMGIDPAQIAQINMTESFRDALKGIGWPAEWLADETAVEQAQMMMAQKKKMEEGAAAIGGAAQIAKTGAEAAGALADAGVSLG